MRSLFIFVTVFLSSVYVFGQKSEIAGFYLEKVEDIGLWDSIMEKQLESDKYSHISLVHLSADSFDHIVANNRIQLVDVRTKEEYDEGHIPGAVWIDVKADDFIENAKSFIDRCLAVAVYCKGGVRSRRAAEKLLFYGFSFVYNLDKGFEQWKKEGKKLKSNFSVFI